MWWHEPAAFALKALALGAVACAVFEFVMWRMYGGEEAETEEK